MLLKPTHISIDSFYNYLANQARHAPSSWQRPAEDDPKPKTRRKKQVSWPLWTVVEVKDCLCFSVCESEHKNKDRTVLIFFFFFSRKGDCKMPQILSRSISKSPTECVNRKNMPYNWDTLECYSKYCMWPKSFTMWASSQYRSCLPLIHGHRAFFLPSQRSNSICIASSAVLGMEKYYVINK